MNARTNIPQAIEEDHGAAALIATLARASSEALTKPVKADYKDAAPFIVLRDADGKERIEWLSQRLETPARKSGTVALNDAESFIEFFKIHGSNGASPVYASMNPITFIAVLNDNTRDKADWRDHRAVYKPAFSREWKVWTEHNGKGAAFNSNESFALFLEDNAPDIVQPDAAKMMNIALNFRVKSDVQFSIAQRLQDGQVELGFKEIINGTAGGSSSLKIPEEFKIKIPVWDGVGAKLYPLDARFRYRLSDGKLTIWYELVRPHKVIEQAFKDVWDQIEKDAKAKILHGNPG